MISASLPFSVGVDLLDRVIRHLLGFVSFLLVLVLAHQVRLFERLELVHAVAAHVAHGNARLFGILVGDLDEFLAAVLRQVRHAQSDDLPFRLRREAEVRGVDRLFNGDDETPVPDADLQHARFRHRDGGHLVQRHGSAIGIDMDGIEQRGGSAAGAQSAEVVLERFHRTVHAALDVGGVEWCWLGHGSNPS